MRIDSLYADILVQRRLVARSAIEEAFAEQRRRRYRVRVGELLVEQGALSPEGHRAVLGALMRRATEEEPGSPVDATSSGAEKRGLRAEQIAPSSTGPLAVSTPGSMPRTMAKPPPPLPATPPRAAPRPAPAPVPPPIGITKNPKPGAAINLDSRESDPGDSSMETAAIEPPRKPPGPNETVDVEPPHPSGPSFLESNVKLLITQDSDREKSADGDFLASALELRLSGGDEGPQFREDDKKQLAEDVSKAESAVANPALDRVVDKPSATSGEGTRFSPDAWLDRKRRRRRLLFVFVGAWLLAALGLVGAAVAVAVTHRKAFDDALRLATGAEAQPPVEQARIFALARERHAAARGFGVSEQRWLALDARILTSEARATAIAAIEAGDPSTAQNALKTAKDKLAPDDDENRGILTQLQLRADKEALVIAGKEAEKRRDWRTAVECFRNANAEPHLQRVHKTMTDELRALHDAALQSRLETDRKALAVALKVYLEITNDPAFQGLLREVDFSFAFWEADSQLAAGHPAEAIALCKKALGFKDDPETHKLLERAQKRQQLDVLLARARAAARESRLEDAARDFEEALPQTTGDERRRVEGELLDVKRRMGDLERWNELQNVRRSVIELAKASDWDGVAARLPDLEKAGEKDGPKLVRFAQRAKGMVLVPRGAFEYGSSDNAHDPKKLIRPKKTIALEAFLVDSIEVSNKEYAAFARKTNRPAPAGWKENLVLPNSQPARTPSGEYVKTYKSGEDNLPVSGVTWQDAADFAKAAGKRLLADVEWEKAARGTKGQKYPWGEGDPPNDVRINCPTYMKPAACGDSRSDVSPFRVRDLGGNVAEWTGDVHPTADGKKHRIIRGGSLRKPATDARCYAREEGEETKSWEDVGFRCALDLSEAPGWLVEALR